MQVREPVEARVLSGAAVYTGKARTTNMRRVCHEKEGGSRCPVVRRLLLQSVSRMAVASSVCGEHARVRKRALPTQL